MLRLPRLCAIVLLALVCTASADRALAAQAPIAAYSFDEGTGTTLGDASGNLRNGTIVDGTWTTGKFGSALDFNGSSSRIDLPALGTFYKNGFTLEAWVKKASTKSDVAILGSWNYPEGGPMLWYDWVTGRSFLTLATGSASYLDSTRGPAVGTWQHLTATFAAGTARFYVDGTQVSTRAFTGNVGDANVWRIGAYGNSPFGFFDGAIDEVRIYDRALTAAEVATDMNTRVRNDTQAPTAPTAFAKTASTGTSISTSWTASTDNIGVAGYRVYNGATLVTTVTGTTYTFTALQCAASYTLGVEAFDASGNTSSRTTLTTTAGACDATAPTVSLTAPAAGASVTGTVAVSATASDNDSVAGVQFKLDGVNLGAEDTSAPYTINWDTTTATPGAHTLSAVARDPSGNSMSTAGRAVTVVGPAPTPPIAAYAFDDASGTTALDSSGNNRNGTVNGPAWTTGKFGSALDFDGSNDRVDLPALGTFYKTGFTLEAWVKKATVKNDVAVVGSWDGGGPMLWIDHIASHYQATLSSGLSNYLDSTRTPVLGAWQHIAATYDGTTAKFYIDGALVASKTFTGNVGDSNVWRIGAYGGTPGGFFDGVIDEVRIYDRALTGGQIGADMTTAIRNDTVAPSAPTAFTKTGATSTSIATSWTASTDNVAVAGYRLYRNGTLAGTDTDDTAFTITGLTCNTSYTLGVEAFDSAGNTSPRTTLTASTSGCDTTPPSVTLTAPTAGSTVSGTVTVSAAASDDDRVAGVQFKLDGANLGDEDTSAPFSVDWPAGASSPGSHTLTAVARDPSSNSSTSAPVTVTVPQPPPGPSPVAAYSFDDGAGSVLGDATGNGNQGTILGAVSWQPGKYGSALDFNGTTTRVDLPGLGTFYKGAFTLEAWVKRASADTDAGIVGTWNVGQGGGPMLWLDYPNGRTGLTLGAGSTNYLNAAGGPPVGSWQHVAATYDGATAKLYVDGVLTTSKAFTGNVGDSNLWRIGAYGGVAGDYFDGLIDEVRIYDRALTASQVATDMGTALSTRPVVRTTTPDAGATGVEAGPEISATFNQAMLASSLTTSTFQLRDASNALVPATVGYDATKGKATLKPTAALTYGTTYTATIKSGAAGATSASGGTLAADTTWTFTVTSRPPVLLVDAADKPFSGYMAEILKAEGVAGFTTLDVSLLSSTVLSGFEQVILGEVPVSAAQATMLTNFVTAGGDLLASRPDKDLAPLLGLTDLNATLSEGYLKAGASAGITTDTMQYHGAADRYALNGASAVATLYSTAGVATSSPAVSLRTVGTGQAAAFTFDLAKSVVYTRQGNPAWAGQERDGVFPIRPDDLFFGARTGDIKPDWVDMSKVSIPQADESQRLLVNVMNSLASGRTPLPRFWYLPRSLKAAVVMTGDDHAYGGTAPRFDQYLAASPAGCSVADWECVRSTSYLYPESPLTAAQAHSYTAQGFEVALHYSPIVAGAIDCGNWNPATLFAGYDTQMYMFKRNYPDDADYHTGRTHCVSWADWASFPKLEASRGIRLDVNYYYYPGSWVGTKPGFMTGGGFPMRFADTDGTTIDTYQANTVITDESDQAEPATINALLDNALGAKGYYGAFVANIHTDQPIEPDSTAIVAAAQARNVPIISAEQLADWTDGRDRSSFSNFTRSGGVVGFDVTANSKARGLTAMLPLSDGTRTLTALKLGTVTVPFTTQTIKGVQYAFFAAASGRYTATYS